MGHRRVHDDGTVTLTMDSAELEEIRALISKSNDRPYAPLAYWLDFLADPIDAPASLHFEGLTK